MPISGLVKSSSCRPAARSMARAGARCAPSVRTLLRGFNELPDTSESLHRIFSAAKNRRGHHPSVDDGPEKHSVAADWPPSPAAKAQLQRSSELQGYRPRKYKNEPPG